MATVIRTGSSGDIDLDMVLEFRWVRHGHEAGALRLVLQDSPRPEIYSICLWGDVAAQAMPVLATLFRRDH